jgi:uncharacterized protein YdeI (YjbR/CyaY-like superfamily)
MQRGAKAAPGMSAQFRLEPDSAVRVVTVPAELLRALSEERSLRKWFDRLNYSLRHELCKQVSRAGNPAVRSRRAERLAEFLLSAKEAEREVPPAFQTALARNSLAHEGWQLMSPARRRGHLLGIFYYQSPVSREKRMAKAMEDAVLFARKKKNRK